MALQTNQSNVYILCHTPYNDIVVVLNVTESWLESSVISKICLHQVMQDKVVDTVASFTKSLLQEFI